MITSLVSGWILVLCINNKGCIIIPTIYPTEQVCIEIGKKSIAQLFDCIPASDDHAFHRD